MNSYTLDPVQFEFCDRQTSPDRFRGLQEFGPYVELPNSTPCFGFVFPAGSANYANRLFLALKNGIGYFRGLENTFRCSLTKDQVFPIPVTGYAPSSTHDHAEIAKRYNDAILSWCDSNGGLRPDLLYVIHPRTSTYELRSTYYNCKAQLLRHGFLSQSVTLELLNNEAQFRSAAANLGLASFVKLGGMPWVIRGTDMDRNLILGVGRAYLYDPRARSNTGYMAFTACFSAGGSLKFIYLGELVDSNGKYLEALTKAVECSIDRSTSDGQSIRSLTVHAPKELRGDEMNAIRDVLESNAKRDEVQLLAVKVTDESQYFVVDNGISHGIPPRGTVVQATDRDFILYTEGRNESDRWRRRLPVALRVTPQSDALTGPQTRDIVKRVNDLSQMNCRGFNSRSDPIPTYYGSLIAKLLSHIPRSVVADLQGHSSMNLLQERMWFL